MTQNKIVPWSTKLNRQLGAIKARSKPDAEYAQANVRSVLRTVQGQGPDSPVVNEAAGARAVVNISSAHVPGFCKAGQKAYLNCYDLAYAGKGRLSASRLLVDKALPLSSTAGLTHEGVYFAALELNGTGIRFYGDVCFVLKHEVTSKANPDILDRNSYDVLRSPAVDWVQARPEAMQEAERARILKEWSGRWNTDLGHVAAIKALLSSTLRGRRWTAGQISELVRADEDYVEVLMPSSFGVGDLQEARFTASEAAADAHVSRAVSRRPLPKLEALIWHNRRRKADEALRKAGVLTRIVTTTGRTKT